MEGQAKGDKLKNIHVYVLSVTWYNLPPDSTIFHLTKGKDSTFHYEVIVRCYRHNLIHYTECIFQLTNGKDKLKW